MRVTGLLQERFDRDVIASRLGDYFYARGCSVKEVTIHSNIGQTLTTGEARVVFNDAKSLKLAIRLHGDKDVSGTLRDRPYGRLRMSASGLRSGISIATEAHGLLPLPKVQIETSQPAQIPTPQPSMKNALVRSWKREKTFEKDLDAPWQPRQECVQVGIPNVVPERLHELLLGDADQNLIYLQTLAEVTYDVDKEAFDVKTRNLPTMRAVKELIADLVNYVKEKLAGDASIDDNEHVDPAVESGILGVQEKLRMYNSTCAAEWLIPVSEETEHGESNVTESRSLIWDDIQTYNVKCAEGWQIPLASLTADLEKDIDSTCVDEDDAGSVSSDGNLEHGDIVVERVFVKAVKSSDPWICSNCTTHNYVPRSCHFCGQMCD